MQRLKNMGRDGGGLAVIVCAFDTNDLSSNPVEVNQLVLNKREWKFLMFY